MDTSPKYMVCQALQYAYSQDTNLIKSAEAKLVEWEIQSGFYTTLVQIFSDHSLDTNVRFMAAVYFKNGVNKHWRISATNGISEEEKNSIRNEILNTYNEPVPQIAIQIATIISRIARLDWSIRWPDLIPKLLQIVQNTNELEQQRALLVLCHVIKALSSKRLMSDRFEFGVITTNIYTFICNLWSGFTTMFFQSLRDQMSCDVVSLYIEKVKFTTRILRKLTIFGYTETKSECILFLKSLFPILKQLLECRIQIKDTQYSSTITTIEKVILKKMKIFNEFIEHHPIGFIDLIPTALQFSFTYIFDEGTNLIFDDNEITFTNFAIHCINLMKGILTLKKDMVRLNKLEWEVKEELQNNLKQFFTQNRLNYICEKILMHYFLLTKEDLDKWDSDPEEFGTDESGDSWKYSLRPCSEYFFINLFNEYDTEMRKALLSYIDKVKENTLNYNSQLRDILIKDSIYNAAGIVSFPLYDEIDFSEWFTKQLIIELGLEGPIFRITRRRIIWLIGIWASVKLSDELRPQVYRICMHLLQPKEDMAVRLAAAKTLMLTMDDFAFESEKFIEFLEPVFSLLMNLLKSTSQHDTKMHVLSIVTYVIHSMQIHIEKEAINLINYLPSLWEESADHNMLRVAIISTMIQIIKSLADVPQNSKNFIYPVISMSTDTNDPSHVYLLEEALDLWLIVVENSTSLTPELVQLSKNLLTVIEYTSENLHTSLCLIQSYIILNPTEYLNQYGENIIKICSYLLSDLRDEGIVMIMKLFETCLRANPEYGLELLRPVLANIFLKVYEGDFVMSLTMYLTIMARVLLLNPSLFINTIEGLDIKQPLETILDVWLARMNVVTQLEKRKLLGLAIASLLTIQRDVIHERISAILVNIYEILNDVMKLDTDVYVDSLILVNEKDLNINEMRILEVYDTTITYNHYKRCRDLYLRDPVHTINLKDYVQSQLNAMREMFGIEKYTNLMNIVDPQILQNLSTHNFIKIFPEQQQQQQPQQQQQQPQQQQYLY